MLAAPPPPDDPVVFVRLYGRNARIEGVHDRQTGLYSFRGLRYAEPPLALERFMRPRFRHLRGDIDATAYGPPCPQPDVVRGADAVLGDEDCLRLNVYTPRLPDESSVGLPVVIFVHGGGFRYGSANQYGVSEIDGGGDQWRGSWRYQVNNCPLIVTKKRLFIRITRKRITRKKIRAI